MKGVGPPTYHLGGDIQRLSDGKLAWGSKTYIIKILDQYTRLFPDESFKKSRKIPLPVTYHPELDLSPLLDLKGIRFYQSLIGMLQWAVTLGRYDIQHAVMPMSRFHGMTRAEHLEKVKGMFSYLANFRDTSIIFDRDQYDHSKHVYEEHKWKYVYEKVKEEVPEDCPEPRGHPVVTTSYFDANLMHDIVTGRSVSGVLQLLNKTPIEWFIKRQNNVETAVYGSEFMVGRIAVEQIMEIRYMLRALGVPVKGRSYLFADNMSTITSSTIPSSSLKKRHNMLSYDRVREAIATGVIHLIHIPGTENPADVLTKSLVHPMLYALMKPYIFYTKDKHTEQK